MLALIQTKICNNNHRLSHKNTLPTAQWTSKADDADQQAWTKLAADNFFMNLDYLKALEQNLPNSITPYYLVVEQNGVPMVAVYCQMYEFLGTELAFLKTKNKKIIHNLTIDALQCTKFRFLTIGNFFQTASQNIAKHPTLSDEDALRIVLKQTTAEKQNIGFDAIILKDTTSADANPQGFHAFYTEPNMVVEINKNWACFDDYLDNLSSKYRIRAKNVLKHTQTIDKHLLSNDQIETYQTRLYELFGVVCNEANFSVGRVKQSYFYDLKCRLEDQFQILGYFLEGELIGFASFFINKRQQILESHFVGFQYEHNKTYKLYQTMLYDFVRFAIENQSQKLYLSRTAPEIKSTVGAVPQTLNCAIRFEQRLTNYLLANTLKYIPQSPWTQRRPFKDPQNLL